MHVYDPLPLHSFSTMWSCEEQIASHRNEETDAALSDDLEPPMDEGVRDCVGQDERDAICDEEADVQVLRPHLQASVGPITHASVSWQHDCVKAQACIQNFRSRSISPNSAFLRRSAPAVRGTLARLGYMIQIP